jgi:[NiFe] hydrogenase diaphorase moiety large subunit
MPLKTMHQEQNIEAFVDHLMSAGSNPSRLLQYLVSIQHAFGGVPAAAVARLAHHLERKAGDVVSVASFYSLLNLDPSTPYQILFSDNITDHFQGSAALMERLRSQLGPQDATLRLTSCTGLCDQGPALLVNGLAINHLDEARIDQLARLIGERVELEQWPADFFKIEDNIQRRDSQLGSTLEPGAALRRFAGQDPEALLNELDASNLRGRGGAGFKTATKWRYCRAADADTRYVVCNADEGEPGTFKDRVLLNRYADAVFEGMTLCARAIGARHGLVYLRGEYRFLLDKLNAVLEQRRQQGLLGTGILGQAGFDFDIEIHLGAGAYICGEESALLNSLEGRRGNPRIRPPFPVQQGYLGQPTVVNNVETFWSVCHIAYHGASWFMQHGTEQSRGSRLLSISGDCTRPGIYEYPFGVSLADILSDCGGDNAQAVQMAGAAGHTVLARDFDRTLSFEDLATGGSFMVIGAERDLLDVLYNFASFFQHESCGFCTPCRVGTRLIYECVEAFRQGKGSSVLLDQLRAVADLMQRDSFCGLGSSAPTAFLDVLQQSPDVFTSRMQQGDGPTFDLEEALVEFRSIVSEGVGRG